SGLAQGSGVCGGSEEEGGDGQGLISAAKGRNYFVDRCGTTKVVPFPNVLVPTPTLRQAF
ncbi:MAG: hypothetical protein WA261_19325, partial [Candidatus Sulfotelmatobacter sp.]